MIESLKSKLSILEEIRAKDAEQLALIKTSPFPNEAFDRNLEEKDALIYRINKLDQGFQIVYDNIKAEFEKNKDLYKDEIREMQDLITKITDLSASVQAEEARNKAALENYFSSEKARIKQGRSSVKAIRSYNQSIINARGGVNGLIDHKK